jgi:hypothetical protein
MELYSAEAKAITGQLTEWLAHPEYELETTFGDKGVVDVTTFLAVAKRLRAKGFVALPQEDRLTVTTKDHVRFSLSGLGIIQSYCRDDIMTGKPFVAMIKDRAGGTANVDLEEYGVRIKNRRELPMAADDATLKKLLADDTWPRTQKAFRMIRRWSFEGDGIVYDLSIVRSTKKTVQGDYRWQRRFRDQDVMQNAPTYEIEVELKRKEGDTPETALKRLVRGVGEVLRGIQKNSVLIRATQKKKVFDAYRTLVGSTKFRGPSLRTLQKKNFSKEREGTEANIRDGYNVTDKADGLRCLAFCDEKGELFLLDMNMTSVYRTGLVNPECRKSLIDGEWVTQTADKKPINQYLAFDIFYAVDGTDVSKLPFQPPALDRKLESRHGQLEAWIARWNKDEGPKRVVAGLTAVTQTQVLMKTFVFARAGDDSIFRQAARVLDTARPYYTDGLIFTSNTRNLPQSAASVFYEQFKWKPPKDNTIDFLVSIQKEDGSKTVDRIQTGVNPDTGETVSYKTLRLFVGSSKVNAREIILNGRELPPLEYLENPEKAEYKPVLFAPSYFPDPMASVCYLETHEDPDTGSIYVQTEDTEEPIQDQTIVEMAYDPTKEPGWRWKPLRVRMDKTERLQRGMLNRSLNAQKTADDVWNSIYDPITNHMIRTGEEEPSAEEQAELMRMGAEVGGAYTKKYYERRATVEDKRLTRGMRDFHNKWIKERVLYRTGLAGKGKTLIDMACGVGADLQIWRRCDVAFVLGVDYSGDNIKGMNDSIYKRYMESMMTAGGKDRIAPMVFAIGNSARNYVTGEAGETEEDKDILRSVLGKQRPVGPPPPWVAEVGASRLKVGADCMACMFAIHYFFENADTLRGFMKNIADNLKVGGYFIGAAFDGEKVFNLLRTVSKGDKVSGMEEQSVMWSITKGYDEDDIPDGEEGLGLAVDVEFVTIGATHREYLVPYPLLKKAMEAIGCEELSGEDLKKAALKQSSSTFDQSWEMAKKAGKNFVMPGAVQQFSFLNRWFIFKRTKLSGALEETRSGMATIKRAAAVPGPTMAAAPAASNEEEEESAAAAPAAPGAAVAAAPTYALGELFQFFSDAAEKDTLGIKDKAAGQWLAPTAAFPITDPDDEKIIYPSLNHYLAAMRFRKASDKPELAASLFGTEGTIHQKYQRTRLLETEGGTKPLPEKREKELLKQEGVEVREMIRPSVFKKYKATFDDARWATQKDEVLREGVRQRWEKDARFRKIVEAARDKGKTLLYYAPGANSTNLGGVRRTDGRIEGENQLGRVIMELAGF